MRILSQALIVLFCFVLGGCGSGEAPITNDRLIETFESGRTGIWVSGHGEVTQILGDENIGGRTQRFIVRLNEQIQIQIRHSLDNAERIPVERGDEVRFQGYYEWEARGGFISRTYNDESQPGSGGWVEHDGTRYD